MKVKKSSATEHEKQQKKLIRSWELSVIRLEKIQAVEEVGNNKPELKKDKNKKLLVLVLVKVLTLQMVASLQCSWRKDNEYKIQF